MFISAYMKPHPCLSSVSLFLPNSKKKKPRQLSLVFHLNSLIGCFHIKKECFYPENESNVSYVGHLKTEENTLGKKLRLSHSVLEETQQSEE